MIYAGIVAGGVGKRFGGDIPKQFLPLGNKPILVHTVEKFLLCQRIDSICVGINENWVSYAKDIFYKYGLADERIIVSIGGNTRNDTIMNIISTIENKFGILDDDIIITHDAVRPFVSLKIIGDNISAAKKFGACDTVVCANDTIVKSDKNQTEIEEIPNRNFMFLGQTPQSFNMKKLKLLFEKISDENKNNLTDACKIFTINNEKVKLVKGEFSNFKITTQIDYKISQTLIQNNKST